MSRLFKPQLRCNFNSWASAIKEESCPHKAMNLLSEMHRRSITIDTFSILFTLNSISSLRNTFLIRHLHSHITKIGFSDHVYVATSLLNAYTFTSFKDARNLFDQMSHRNTVTWNTMLTGYSRSGDINGARSVFDATPCRDIASWSAMISAYVFNGKRIQGLTLFQELIVDDELKPDQVTIICVSSACAQMGSVGLLAGKSIHAFVVKNSWQLHVELGTALVDMYAKCSFLTYANKIFESMKVKNVMTWTALICGLAQHSDGKEALLLYNRMQETGVKANDLTLTGILKACAHTGLVEEGRKYFRKIKEPRIQHYGCMVDLFGKAGLLEEAYGVIRTMELEPNAAVWGSFLSGCKEHKRFDMVEKVIEEVLRTIKPEKDGGIYSLISELYVWNEKWEDAERVRNLMFNRSVRKPRGSSFIAT